jgi:hypothetical protein
VDPPFLNIPVKVTESIMKFNEMQIHRLRNIFLVPGLLSMLFFMHCGKKGIPPSPDRWKPKVKKVIAEDRNHLKILFSEKISKETAEDVENYSIMSADDYVLFVIGARMEKDGITVYLTTEKQRDMEYIVEIKGILDLAGNEVKGGTRKIRGSNSLDHISPTLLSLSPAPGKTNINSDSLLILTFSETMDTASVRGGFTILPHLPFDLHWNPSLSVVQIGVRDGYHEKYVNRVYVTKGCRDYAGNSLKTSSSTFFTLDDSLPKGTISGRIVLPRDKEKGDSPDTIKTIIGLLDEERNLLLLEVVQEEGEFNLTALSTVALNEEELVEGIPLLLRSDREEGPAAVLKKYYPLLD